MSTVETTLGGVRDLTITVQAQSGPYPVRLRPGILAELPQILSQLLPAHSYALVSDTTVFDLYGATVLDALIAHGLATTPFTFPDGESSKGVETWQHLTNQLVQAGMGRDAVVIGLGGGVTTDLAGFVAATYMRGLPLVQVPTSVLAMVDAAVGGKVGINLATGKNLVGAFHPPRVVVTDPELCRSLAPRLRAEGWVEAVKHGAISDAGHVEHIRESAGQLLAGDVDATTAVLARTIAIKAGVVSRDERERGPRELLNFGHTLGHAIERTSGWRVPHGRAVALGMVAESRAAELEGRTAPGTSERLRGALAALGIDVSLAGLVPESILQATTGDKKSRKGETRYVVLSELGRADPSGLAGLSDSALLDALSELG